MKVTPDRRQFTISRQPWPVPDGWRAIGLPHGYTLHHHPDLRVTRAAAGDLERITLGHAFDMLGHGAGGRFATIEGSTVCTDECGLLALLYRQEAQGVTVTSSAALACRAFGGVPSQRRLPRYGMNWHPSPGSPVQGWARLMADQCLDLASGAITANPKTLASDLSEEQAAERLLGGLTEFMTLQRSRFSRTLLPLTAGLDSRTLFTALCASGIEFETFTQVFDEKSRHDADTARKLALRHGVPHFSVLGLEPREEHRRRLYEHQLDSVRDADATTLFAGGFYRHLHDEDVIVRGGLFELGRLDYLGRLWRVEAGDPRDVAAQIITRFGEDPGGPLFETLKAWWVHRRANPIGLELGDAFFFDQDIGGWMASIEQGLDSLPPTSLHPMNSLALLRCVMSASPRRRRAGWVQRRAIARFDKALDDVPYNLFDAWRHRIRGTPLEYGYYWLRALVRP